VGAGCERTKRKDACLCQYPGCDSVVKFFKILPLGEIGWKAPSIFLHYFLPAC
jgi:hypothetical protein